MKEQFSIAACSGILKLIDAAANQAGLSRGQAFEDFLTFVRCSLAGQTMEEEYLQTVAKGYDRGERGKRGIDLVARAFGELVLAMEDTQQDVLGDLFTGAITYGERGQFFTPDHLTRLMAQLTTSGEEGGGQKTVNDPTCGSGRFLLAVGRDHPNWELIGQDVDHRCAQMTAINLGLSGLKGGAIWQNTLSLQCHRVYRIGFNVSGGVIYEVPVDQSPFSGVAHSTPESPSQSVADAPPYDPGTKQLDLF